MSERNQTRLSEIVIQCGPTGNGQWWATVAARFPGEKRQQIDWSEISATPLGAIGKATLRLKDEGWGWLQ